MLYTKETYQSQKKLTNWVRTGTDPSVPGTVFEGLKQYRRLFRNNINNTMMQAFPITLEILTKEQWELMVDEFFAIHNSQTPHIWKLPFEFYQFVESNNFAEKFNKPFLNDLLHFEWIEIDVYTMADEYPEPYNKHGDSFNERLECNNEYRLINLKYPVHLYAAKEAVNHIGDYYLLSYRVPETFKVKFINLPPLHVLFFEKISNEGMTAKEILDEFQTQNPEIEIEQLKSNLLDFISKMLFEKVFLGFSQTYHN